MNSYKSLAVYYQHCVNGRVLIAHCWSAVMTVPVPIPAQCSCLIVIISITLEKIAEICLPLFASLKLFLCTKWQSPIKLFSMLVRCKQWEGKICGETPSPAMIIPTTNTIGAFQLSWGGEKEFWILHIQCEGVWRSHLSWGHFDDNGRVWEFIFKI